MLRRWTAREVARRDHSLCGFWPLADNLLDRSGQGRHANVVRIEDWLIWLGWNTNWADADVPTWNGSGFLSNQAVLVKHANRVGFWNNNDPQVLLASHNPLLDISQVSEMSVSFWFTTPYDFADAGLISQMQMDSVGNRQGWEFIYDDGHIKFRSVNDWNLADYFELDYLADGGDFGLEWNHVAITYKTDTYRLFINGHQVLEGTYSPKPSAPNAHFLIGATRGTTVSGFSLGGSYLGLVRAYSRTLSDTDVVDIYRREKNCYNWRPRYGAKPPSVIPLYTLGHLADDNNMTLCVTGGLEQVGQTPLMVRNNIVINEDKTLFIQGPFYDSDSATLFTKGSLNNQAFNGLTLYMDAILGKTSRGFPLYVPGPSSDFSHHGNPLFVENHLDVTNVPLSVYGGTKPYNQHVSLFLDAKGSKTRGLNLVLKGPDVWPMARAFSLFVGSATFSPVNRGVPLFIDGVGRQEKSRGMSLFTITAIGEPNHGMSLFTLPGAHTPTGHIPMYLYGEGLQSLNSSFPLIIPGNCLCCGNWEDWNANNWEDIVECIWGNPIGRIGFGSPMMIRVEEPTRGQVMYIRVREGDGIGLVCGPPTKTYPSSVDNQPPLYVYGARHLRDGNPLFVVGDDGYLTDPLRMSIYGANSPKTYMVGGPDLFLIGDKGSRDKAIPLVIPVVNTGSLLQHSPLFISGVYNQLTDRRTLYVHNHDAGIVGSGATDLYLEGPPKVDLSGSLKTYLHVAAGGGATLVLLGPPGSDSQGLPFTVVGAVPLNGAAALSMPAVYSILRIALEDGKLYTHGF